MPSFESQSGIGSSRKSQLIPLLLLDPSLTFMIATVAVTHKFWMTGSNLAISDQVLHAASNLAGYEVLSGSKEHCHVHMNGLTRMICLRGGMGNLGFEGGLERVLLWHDTNFSNTVRSEPYLQRLASTPHLHAAKAGAITAGMIKTEPD